MKRIVLALLLSCVISPCLRAQAQAGPSTVSAGQAWLRAAQRGQGETWAFVTLVNAGDAAALLIAVEMTAARRGELRRAVPTEGGTTSRAIPSIGVAPHATLVMTPETYYLAFSGLLRDLPDGGSAEGTLRFADGTRLPVSFQVRARGAD